MAELIPRFTPGEDVPVFASAQINAGRFVKVTGAKTTHGDYPATHCGAGDLSLGVAKADSAPATLPAHAHDRRVAVSRPGAIARVVAGAAVAVGALVSSDAVGKAITYVSPDAADGEPIPTSPAVLGQALTAAAADLDVIEVALR